MNFQDLSQIALFESLSAAELESIYRAGREYQVQQGLFFFLQGAPANTMYLLAQGRVKLTQLGLNGQQVLVRIVIPFEDFGAAALLSGVTYPLSAQAAEDCTAFAWDKETITRLLAVYPHLALNALRLLAERFRELQERYRELATERVERRVAHALLRLKRQAGRQVNGGALINLSLSHQDLAEMTGTTLYTVSRIFSQWEQQGLIQTGRARVVILNPQGLIAIAEDLPNNAVVSRLI